MSKVQFSDDKILALVKPLRTGDEPYFFLSAEKFWKKFGLTDDMRELQAQAVEKLASVGVDLVFEVTLSLLADAEEVEEDTEEVADAQGGALGQPHFTAEQLESVVDAIAEEEDQVLFLTTDEFWTHFGLTNVMENFESQASERFNLAGVNLSFDVVLSFIPESVF